MKEINLNAQPTCNGGADSAARRARSTRVFRLLTIGPCIACQWPLGLHCCLRTLPLYSPRSSQVFLPYVAVYAFPILFGPPPARPTIPAGHVRPLAHLLRA